MSDAIEVGAALLEEEEKNLNILLLLLVCVSFTIIGQP